MNHESIHTPEQLGHEPSEPGMFPIVLSMVGFLGITMLGLAVVAFVLTRFSASRERNLANPAVRSTESPPSSVPPLSAHLAEDLEQLRARERQLLTQYKWIDEKEGIARIPIERAIEILAARVKPTAPQPHSPEATHE
jgi:hypothetical protein